MPDRKANAVWEGTLKEGKGHMKMPSQSYDGPYTWSSRFEEATGTNPEELIAAAHAGCFSMAFANDLDQAGHTANRVETEANVHLEPVEGGFGITRIELSTEAEVPGIEEAEVQRLAEGS